MTEGRDPRTKTDWSRRNGPGPRKFKKSLTDQDRINKKSDQTGITRSLTEGFASDFRNLRRFLFGMMVSTRVKRTAFYPHSLSGKTSLPGRLDKNVRWTLDLMIILLVVGYTFAIIKQYYFAEEFFPKTAHLKRNSSFVNNK